MNQRDLSELRRRLNPDRRNPTMVRGCYVGSDGQVIAAFAHPVFQLPQEENEKYMALFKRVLSGAFGQNLLHMDFSAAQVMEGEEHRLLSSLLASALKDESAVEAFYQRVIDFLRSIGPGEAQSVNEQLAANNHLILLLHDGYDVPYRDANGEADQERSTDVFNYILCCVCPVKQTKPALSYYAAESEFHARSSDWVVSPPELGFLFPAYEERSANIYSALFYTRDISNMHEGFIENIFHTEPLMPAVEQKQTFQSILETALDEECSMDVVQAVHETVCGMIEEQKADKTAGPLCLTSQAVKTLLEDCGVSAGRASAFEEQYNQAFGGYAELPAVNLVTPKQFKVDTPSVSIRVDPARSDLIETRIIDGRRYVLVLADGDVQVNGVSVKFKPEEPR